MFSEHTDQEKCREPERTTSAAFNLFSHNTVVGQMAAGFRGSKVNEPILIIILNNYRAESMRSRDFSNLFLCFVFE